MCHIRRQARSPKCKTSAKAKASLRQTAGMRLKTTWGETSGLLWVLVSVFFGKVEHVHHLLSPFCRPSPFSRVLRTGPASKGVFADLPLQSLDFSYWDTASIDGVGTETRRRRRRRMKRNVKTISRLHTRPE